MKTIQCPLCGTSRTMGQCQISNCSHCTAEISTDRNNRVSKVRLRVGTLLPELKSLVSRRKRAEAEALLDELQNATLYRLRESSRSYEDEDNYRVVQEVREQFREWVIQ